MTHKDRLSEIAITEHLEALKSWQREGQFIFKSYQFEGFLEAIAFVNKVAKAAEDQNHHPDIDIRWNKVRLAMTSHDVEGLTPRDFHLAQTCDALETEQ